MTPWGLNFGNQSLFLGVRFLNINSNHLIRKSVFLYVYIMMTLRVMFGELNFLGINNTEICETLKIYCSIDILLFSIRISHFTSVIPL